MAWRKYPGSAVGCVKLQPERSRDTSGYGVVLLAFELSFPTPLFLSLNT